jgi:hypothetical protein
MMIVLLVPIPLGSQFPPLLASMHMTVSDASALENVTIHITLVT